MRLSWTRSLPFWECKNFLSCGIPRVLSLSVVQMRLLKQHLQQASIQLVWQHCDSYRVRCAGEFSFSRRGTEANRIGFLFSVRGELPANWASVARKGLIRKWHVLCSIFSHSFFLLSLSGVQRRQLASFIRNTGLVFIPSHSGSIAINKG
jgi:hypothetical protein